MKNSKKKGSRFIGVIITLLIILFLIIEFFIRESQELYPTSVTNILLSSLQIIVFLLFLVLCFVLGRNLIKLYLEKKRKVVGSHFKTKLVLFFIALSFIPTLLLFLFASDLVSRNIEHWFKTPIDKILEDTQDLADGFYLNSKEITLHYANQLSRALQKQNLINLESQQPLKLFIREKLKEYDLDQIGIYVDDEELFSYFNPDLPFQNYRDLKTNIIKRAQLGEIFSTIEPMGAGEMIRRGISFNNPDIGNVLVVVGKYLPKNYAQRINNITAYVQRYRQLEIQKRPVKTFYLMTLVFITLLIIFAASWIGFHLAKGITVPIEKLAHATKQVSRGNLNIKVEDPASDELGILIESFNQMVSDLKESHSNVEQKTLELATRKQYIETVLNNINTGVITLDAKGIITTINPCARRMLSLENKNLIGKNYMDVFKHPKYHEINQNIQWGIKNKYILSDKEINISSAGQNVILALSISPLRESNNKFSGIIIVLDNLTQLLKAQKIAAWKEVAQRVAHEIKNPLTPIQLSAERIIKNLKKTKKDDDNIVREGAHTIVEGAKTIKSLVDEFSNFARMPSIRLRPTDIHEILEQSIFPFRGIFKDIEFKISFSPDVPSQIMIDPEQMKRVFINLLDNSIDAMNKKGIIKVDTNFDKHNNKVIIEVSDTGTGISHKDIENIFSPDFSTKKKGRGLGLAIVNQVINEHNGSIEVTNNSLHGAKFTIRVPA